MWGSVKPSHQVKIKCNQDHCDCSVALAKLVHCILELKIIMDAGHIHFSTSVAPIRRVSINWDDWLMKSQTMRFSWGSQKYQMVGTAGEDYAVLTHHNASSGANWELGVKATPSNIPKWASCGLYKKSGSGEMRLMVWSWSDTIRNSKGVVGWDRHVTPNMVEYPKRTQLGCPLSSY